MGIAVIVVAAILAIVVVGIVGWLTEQQRERQFQLETKRLEVAATQAESLDKVRMAEIDQEANKERVTLKTLEIEGKRLDVERWNRR